MQGERLKVRKTEEREEKRRKEEEKKKKKKNRGTVESNRGSFPTSFLLLALYRVQQSVSIFFKILR